MVLVLPVLLTFTALAEYRFLENGSPMGRGPDAGEFVDTPTRSKIDLSGVWNYSVEGGPSGTVKVPSAYDFTGKVTFERTFEITSEMLDKYQFFLVLSGVNHSCEVSLNGDFISSHSGGYTSIMQSIPHNTLQVGKENNIRVVVSNELDPRRTLPLRPDPWGLRNYGGILRDVFFLCAPKLAIGSVQVVSGYSLSEGAAELTVDATFEGELVEAATAGGKQSTALGMYVELLDKISGFQAAKSPIVPLTRNGNAWDTVRTVLTLHNPKVWSPDSPELYLMRVFLVQGSAKEFSVIDEYDLNQGIRNLDLSGGHFVLNGKRIVLKGVVWQEDHPDFGSAMSYEELEKDIVLIKSLGANTVRFGSHPPHPYMLNLCDRYGLFALEEIPVTGAPSSVLGEENFAELASTMMKEMIQRDRGHVSVLAWGVGNEFESSTPVARTFVENMVRVASSLDDRPTYFGTQLVDADVCAGLVSIAALDIHTQDVKVFRKQLEEWKSKNSGRPVMITEFGTEVKQNDRNGYSDPFSYEAQARFYIQRFDVIRSLDYDGALVWSFNDWKGDRPSLAVNGGDPWMRSMGLVSADREKRVAYDAVRSVFRGEKFVALPIGNYATSAPIVFVLSGLVLLIGTAYFYNANRRFRDNLNRSVMNLYNFFADVRDQRIVSVVQTTVLSVIISVAAAIVASSMLYHFRQSRVLDNLLSFILVSDSLKESAVRLIWSPIKSIVEFSALFFLMFLLLYVLLLLLSTVTRAKIFSYHAFVISVWSATPFLVLVPVGMILYRIMDSQVYVMPSLLFVAALLIWFLMRLFKGMSIIFDMYLMKVYVIGSIVLIGAFSMAFVYYDYTQSASMYLSYMYDVMAHSQ